MSEPTTSQGPGFIRQTSEEALPEIDFATFVLSLNTSVLVLLGESPDPDGTTQQDLGLARETIDILTMLQTKTVGNLTDEEAQLLRDIIYDLRLRYVAAAQRP